MEIVVLGATGRTGRLVVEQALMRGDEVVAYVRNPHGIATNPGFETVVGAIYQDKERSEALLPGSGLKWTSVYPVILTDGPLADAVEVRCVLCLHLVVRDRR